ncbi:MAG TPA: phosphoesterase PA-phosphatase [Ruminococcaceae bacterium]|nr:phosphoesterase PA-phosphatase [Oscillospiraceae bacterium]
MKDKFTKNFCITGALLVLFFIWTALVSVIDCQPIGPNGSTVGFATMNRWFHALTGEHLALYDFTDFISFIPFVIVAAFGIYGAIQLLQRKSLFKVDSDIIALGGFYLIVLGCYALFQVLIINYRPILIEGALEASYPSSTTVLATAVFPTAAMQIRDRFKKGVFSTVLQVLLVFFTVFMVIVRLVSGVHWLSDILGGLLLSAALVMGYLTTITWLTSKEENA